MYKPVEGAQVLPVPSEVQDMFDWAAARGIKWPKIVYPVLFPPGYIGSMATEDIHPGESIVVCPNDTLFTTKVAANSDLKAVFESNSSLFDPNSNSYDDLVLTSFIIYEKSKGSHSKWQAFIGYQPKTPSNLQDWTKEELAELQDEDLIYDTSKSLESHIETWENWRKTLLKYPEKFTEEMVSLSEFTWAIRLIGTRTFGKFAPYSTFFPVGELLNHDNVETYYIYLSPNETPDCTQRYSGIVNDEDHDVYLYEVNPSVELSNEALTICAYLLNNGLDHDTFIKLKNKAGQLDKSEAAQERLKKVYRAPDMDLTESSEKEMRIVAGPNEHYEKGSEVYMTYGRNSNRQLLSVYGFSLKTNHFNFAIFKTQVKNLLPSIDLEEKLRVKDFTPDLYIKFKLKQKVLCLSFIDMIRKMWWKSGHPIQAFFEAKLLELELSVMTHAIKLLTEYLNTFNTSYDEDLKILETEIPLRKYFAVLYRSQVKEIISNQIEYCNAARNIISNGLSGENINESIEKELNSVQDREKVLLGLSGYIEQIKN